MAIPYLCRQGNKTILKVDDRPYIAVAGEVHNSDSSSVAYMEGIWKIADQLHMNTLLLPVSWEMIEPEEDHFDFSNPKALIDQAREHHQKIVFLWFGSWKNAEMMYCPSWVKEDRRRFRRGQIVKGQDKADRKISTSSDYGFPYYTISYLCEDAMNADAKAFSRFMGFLKEYDENENTVIMVQVENETGLLGAAREVSDEADEAFDQTVPADLLSYLRQHTETMTPEIKDAVLNGAENGSWKEVFGDAAEELFSAYHVASYVEHVAKAGKEVYPLPMSANCWLNKGDEPGTYPSGGPVSKVHEVWNCCAPSIDLLTPDIYVPNFSEICDEYTRRGTALMIPECATHSYCAPRLVYAVGHYHAIGYSPFGFDDIGKPFTAVQGFLFGMDVQDPALKTPQDFEEYAKTSELLRMLLPEIGTKLGTNDLQASNGETAPYSQLYFGNIVITTAFQSPIQPRTDGYCLVIKEKEDQCLILGNACTLLLHSADREKRNLDILCLEEGVFNEDHEWVPGRRLNGDEAAMLSFKEPSIWRLTYHIY